MNDSPTLIEAKSPESPGNAVASSSEKFGMQADEKFSDEVANYIHKTLNTRDTNNDGILSREELAEAKKFSKTPTDRKAADFVGKHFGALTLLSTDSMFSEGGISRADALNLHGNSLTYARASFIEKYNGGTRIGAELSRNYFNSTHARPIRTMLREINKEK